MFNRGDIVRIIEPSRVYSSYDRMAKLLHLTNWRRSENIYDEYHYDHYEFLGHHEHTEYPSQTVCAIRNTRTGGEYLLEIGGIGLINRPIHFDDELFKL